MSPLPHSPRAVAMITALVRGEAAAYKVRFAAAAASNPPKKTSPPSLPSSACWKTPSGRPPESGGDERFESQPGCGPELSATCVGS